MAMSPNSLKALLTAEKQDALGVGSAKLSEERSRALDYYMGDVSKDMPSQDGRSSAVSQDVLDTVEGLMPSLMEIFCAGEEVVRFEPVGPEDEDAAEQESDYVNHVFMQKNPGFLVLYSFIKDALLSKVGVVKVDWDKSEKEERETYLDQPDDSFAVLAAQPDMEIAEHSEHKDEQGQTLHDVTLVRRKSYGCAKVMGVPPEEFGISKRARSIRDAHYCYHEVVKTEADLLDQGYDPEQVKKLPSQNENSEEEKLSRDTVEEEQTDGDTMNRAMRPIVVTEHYVRMAYEDKPQLYRVTTGGDELEVLRRDGKPDVVPVDMMPFAAMTPVIITHRFFGRSVADLVMDIQRIKTALLRNLLDNQYMMNNQRMEIADSHAHERTLDDLLVNRPGGIIRTKTPGGLIPIPNQPLGPTIFPVLEYMDATREWRTGVTRQGQGLAPDSLQNIGERAVLDAANAAQARMKLIARIFAETGVRDLFQLLHGVIRKNDRQLNTVRLRNKWVQVDPRNWKTREDMTVNVGLGTGSRESQIQQLMVLLGFQKEAILLPGQNIVKPKNVYNTLEKMIERMGLKTIEPYFTDPEDPENPPPEAKPSPEEMKIQADTQIKQAELQQRGQELQVKAELDKQADERKAQIEQVQAQADMATQDRKTQADMMLAQQRFEFEKELKLMDFQLKREMQEQELQMRREQHQQAMASGAFKIAAGAEQHSQKMKQASQKGAE